jgi:predicted nucleic acid-binding protein
MATLIDTNILVRTLNPDDPQYQMAANALAKLRMESELLCIAPQNLIEFWAVATRSPDRNGLGMTGEEAESEITILRRLFSLLPYTPEVLDIWQSLVVRHKVSGKQTHDAHLAAIMHAHSVQNILTFNATDFQSFRESWSLIHRGFNYNGYCKLSTSHSRFLLTASFNSPHSRSRCSNKRYAGRLLCFSRSAFTTNGITVE